MKRLLIPILATVGIFAGALPAFATTTVTVFVINTPICPSRTIGPDGAGNTWEQHLIGPRQCQVTVTQNDDSE